jgi:hypothetical protein
MDVEDDRRGPRKEGCGFLLSRELSFTSKLWMSRDKVGASRPGQARSGQVRQNGRSVPLLPTTQVCTTGLEGDNKARRDR